MPHPHPRAERGLALLALAYFVAAALGVVLDLDPGELASSPGRLVDGEAWRLLTSALVVEGRLPLVQIGLAAAAAFAVVRAHGAIAWWGAVVAAHVGSALVTYGVIGIFDALGTRGAERVVDEPDYGVSIVITGSLGALFAGAWRRRRRDVAALALLGLLAFFPLSLDWYGIEHPLGFALGAGFLAGWERRAAH
jgi:hypothetical protein